MIEDALLEREVGLQTIEKFKNKMAEDILSYRGSIIKEKIENEERTRKSWFKRFIQRLIFMLS